MMHLRTAFLAATLLFGTYSAWQRWEGRPVHPLDGAVAPDDPVQTDIERAAPVRHGRWLLTPRANYDITARILSRGTGLTFEQALERIEPSAADGQDEEADSAVREDDG